MREKKKATKTKGVRDLSVTKICNVCSTSYHPRKNGHQATSRFCSAECSRKGRRSFW